MPSLLAFWSVLSLTALTSVRAAIPVTYTGFAKVSNTDSFGADVYPEGFTGNTPDAETCMMWCTASARCTMVLWHTEGLNICYIKTGQPWSVQYQYSADPQAAPWDLYIRDRTCTGAVKYVADSTGGNPTCTELTVQDSTIPGHLNAACVQPNDICYEDNVCDKPNNICKAPLGVNCRIYRDCSNRIVDPTCTIEGSEDDNKICARRPFLPSQAAAPPRRERMKRAMQHTLGENECPTGLASCPSSYGGGLECVNMLEELDHCGACGNNCLALPGIISTGVSCYQGNCEISRCRRGYSLVNNACIRSHSP